MSRCKPCDRHGEWETMIFPADRHGNIVDWLDLYAYSGWEKTSESVRKFTKGHRK